MEYRILLQESTDTDKTLNLIHHEILEKNKQEFFYLFLDSSKDESLLRFNTFKKSYCIILDILKNSKKLLKMGNDLNKTGNFTSISQKTAIIVQELHYFLLENLAQDEIIILECLEILITHTKYDTLTKGLDILREILERIRDIYASDSRETRVKVQGIKVLQELLSLKISDALDLDILQDLQSRFLKQDQDLKISVYKVLSVFFRNYDSENLYKIWEVSREELDNGCIDKYDGVREFTLKAILEYAKRLKDSMEIERPGNSPEEDIDKQVDWWVQVMKWVLPLINDTSDFVRSAGLEVLSQLSSKVFGKLPSKLVLTLQSIGIGMLSDSNSNVRASACGFLGVLITFESVQKDLLFFSDLIVRIPRITMEDDALVVKVRGSWALANICAAFVDIRKKDLEDFSIPDGYLRKCVEAALFASKDKEKVFEDF